jgi:hypothetical protein
MLFNPLQIADKFNEMQLGMIAANRVLIPKIKFKIPELLKHLSLKESDLKNPFWIYSG